MNSKDIIRVLKSHFKQDARYTISNSFIFNNLEWESDFLLIQKNGLVHEYELKTGRNDYLLDHRKFKHVFFKDPFKNRYYAAYRENVYNGENGPNFFRIEWVKQTPGLCPHRFSYVCPEGLISFEECPVYAGLVWIDKNENVKLVKSAPAIHGKPLKLDAILLEKYYWSSTAFEDKWHEAIRKNAELQKKLAAFEKQSKKNFAL